MLVFTEKTFDKLLSEDALYEASTDTTIIRDNLYPKVEKVLNTPDGKRKFSILVEQFVNRNSSKLTTIGPMYLIPFTNNDKQDYYDLFETSDNEIRKMVLEMVNKANSNANWLFLKNNPQYILFYCVIRYFTINKDPKQLNNALIITALAFYPSIFSKYFKYEVNPGVMHYTIDNLSQRFIIKKTNHIFGMLAYSIQGSWKFHEKDFFNGNDGEIIRFIQRIRNDQNSLMRKISNNYYENHKKGLSVYTQVDSYDDSVIVDNENDTNKVESVTNKIVLAMITNGVDLKLCDFAANAANVSKIELRNYLTKIAVEKNSSIMYSFIESILFLYLYDGKHTFAEINSKQFLSFAIALFKKTNSKDKNITNIKTTLDKWGVDSGIYGKFNRLATRVDYTKGIFLYFVLSIQKYN